MEQHKNDIDSSSYDSKIIEQETEVKENIQKEDNIKNDIIVSEWMKQINSISVSPDPIIDRINNTILDKALSEHGHLQEWVANKSLSTIQKEIIGSHPELTSFLLFDMNINSLSCDSFSWLLPLEKIQIIALQSTIHDKLPFFPGLKNKDWSFNNEKFKQKFKYKVEATVKDLMSNFKWNQIKHFWVVKSALIKEYWLSEADASKYIAYLEKVRIQYESNQPVQWNVWYWIAFAAGVAVTLLWLAVYDRIMNPKWMSERDMWVIDLGDTNVLAGLITAEQDFEVTGTQTDKLYDTSNETGIVWKLKDIANIAQSRKITLALSGKIGVEYTLATQDGASFTYDPSTKLINVQLPTPKFTMRDKKATVLERNSEIIEISKFNNTEQELINSLSEKVLWEAEKQNELVDISINQTANLIYQIYAPVIKRFGKEVKWITVTVNNNKKEFLKW